MPANGREDFAETERSAWHCFRPNGEALRSVAELDVLIDRAHPEGVVLAAGRRGYHGASDKCKLSTSAASKAASVVTALRCKNVTRDENRPSRMRAAQSFGLLRYSSTDHRRLISAIGGLS
jgi:hypothetical protein